MSALIDFLNFNDVEYKENLQMKRLSPIRIGGNASIVIYPDSAVKLISVIDFLEERQIGYRVLGRTSNILLPDDIINTVLVKTDKLLGVSLKDNIFTLQAGETIARHATGLAELGFSGFLGLAGIPGTIGGMLRGNAGAFGDEIGNIVRTAKVYDPECRKILDINASDMALGYRRSIFQDRKYIILSVTLELDTMSSENAARILRENREKRMKTQPFEKPSLGSIFKRPEGDYAARLIDAAGLKGYSIGDAVVSPKHAGFIVNQSNATAKDVKLLIEHIKQTVNAKFGVLLREEIEIL